MKYAAFVIGPAGSGKSTFCDTIKQHCDAINRPIHIVNLDPAAEDFKYPVSLDVRDLITLEDAMEELQLGPNGGLLYCMEYLEEQLDEWLGDALAGYGDDDFLLFDCPGQIELYSHLPAFRSLADFLRRDGWNAAAVHCLDAQFCGDAGKYVAGCLAALSAMVQLELPHLNVLTKMDIAPDADGIRERLLFPDGAELRRALDAAAPARAGLNAAVAALLDDYSMVGFTPLDPTDEDGVAEVLAALDAALQYGEDADVRGADVEAPGGNGEGDDLDF